MEFINGGLTFSTHHVGGSAGSFEALGKDWYHLHLRQDSWFWFNFKITGAKNRRIIFQVRDRTPEMEKVCHYWVRRTKPDAEAKTHHPHYSYDNKTWFKMEHSERDYHEPDLVRFSHNFTQDTVYLCYGIPYPSERWDEFASQFDNHPDFESKIIGQSRMGYDERLVTITDSKVSAENKKVGYLLCREDQAETTGAFALEGCLKYLMAEEQKELRKKYIIYLAPLVSIDGMVCGSPFSGGYGYITGRWQDENPPAEIALLRNFIEKTNPKGSKLAFVGKLHGSVRWDPKDYYEYQEDNRALPHLFVLNEKTAEMTCKYLPEGSLELTLDRLGLRPRGRFERYIADNFDCDTIFATEIYAKDEAEARGQGELIFKGLFESL